MVEGWAECGISESRCLPHGTFLLGPFCPSIPQVSNDDKISMPFVEWPENKQKQTDKMVRQQKHKCFEKVNVDFTFYLQVTTSLAATLKSLEPYQKNMMEATLLGEM